jgi:hypothetical protein
MSGLARQSALIESLVKSPKEAIMASALSGNQTPPVLQRRHCIVRKWIHGFLSYANTNGISVNGVSLPAATPHQRARWWVEVRYRTQIDNYTFEQIDPAQSYGYTLVSSLEGEAFLPSVSGGNTTIWPISQYLLAPYVPHNSGWWFLESHTLDSEVKISWSEDAFTAEIYGVTERCTSELSGQVDVAAQYQFAVAAMFGNYDLNTFAWDTAKTVTFRELPNRFTSRGHNLQSDPLPPGPYDYALLPFDHANGGGLVLGDKVACECGWQNNWTGNNVQIWIGQARVSQAGAVEERYYFIGRWRECYTYNESAFWGKRQLQRRITLIKDGILRGAESVGYGGDHSMPYPAPPALPMPALTPKDGVPCGVAVDFYFAVIEQDPAGWAAQNGVIFGDTCVTYSEEFPNGVASYDLFLDDTS